jgi:phosphatidylserine/phosphatidylglycerophosphate/cardiolipin synthase-like enzyme
MMRFCLFILILGFSSVSILDTALKAQKGEITQASLPAPLAQKEACVKPHYEVCFTPSNSHGDCFSLILEQINKAQKSIHILIYTFTSKKLADALVEAQKRGVVVKIIMDKSQYTKAKRHSAAKFLLKHKMELWNDYSVQISHNKVMIFDEERVLTGSGNFTQAAQKKNAENFIFIEDKPLAQKYLAYWKEREKASQKVTSVD